MITAYSLELIPLQGMDEWWLTLDYPHPDHGGWASDVLGKFKDKEKGELARIKLLPKFNFIPNPHIKHDATTKEERDFIAQCKVEGEEYKREILSKRMD